MEQPSFFKEKPPSDAPYHMRVIETTVLKPELCLDYEAWLKKHVEEDLQPLQCEDGSPLIISIVSVKTGEASFTTLLNFGSQENFDEYNSKHAAEMRSKIPAVFVNQEDPGIKAEIILCSNATAEEQQTLFQIWYQDFHETLQESTDRLAAVREENLPSPTTTPALVHN